ncbi:MAG: hypothetical protein E6Q34_05900 [Burkholderiaceae bacterium]|nr:MAG: hypothetical protein E6Q34_05900 [Burkholderiaceae bacterium]
MDELTQEHILAMGNTIHSWTEAHYATHRAIKGDLEWPDKQRILLADMAMHLLRTSLSKDHLDRQELARNLYAILNISDLFLPNLGLKDKAEQLSELAMRN